MSRIYIIIHKPTKEEIKDISTYLYETLSKLYPTYVHSHYDGSLISIWNGRIGIDMRCGTEPSRLAGICPSYYYTEGSEYVADMLEQGACKVNGRRLKEVRDIFPVIAGFMSMFAQIDTWLDEED